LEFAQWLRETLRASGYEATLDQHDILPGEDWKARLSGLIQTADAVAFCVSPSFSASETCNWELSESKRLGKRLLPLIAIETPESSVPQQLSRLNYIIMRDTAERAAGLPKLIEAINTDIDWIRDHTRYGELASRWSHGNRSRDLLIRGTALQAMKGWLQAASDSAPALTEEIKLFLTESAKEEARRGRVRQRTISLVTVLAILSSLIGAGWWFQDVLREQAHWRLVMKPAIVPLARAAELQSQPGHPLADCENGCPQLVVVPPGTFVMGSIEARFPRERPQRQVTIGRAFAIAQHELTFDEWDHCVASGGCRADVTTGGWGRGTQPAINVTWNDAKQYVAWLSKVTGRRYRLPTEAEWEYAARAGSQEYFSFGNLGADLDAHGWYAENSDNRPQPVAKKRPNKFGLYDMHGNVHEWTEDCANDTYQNAPTDGSAWLKGNCLTRVFRGGSWLHGSRVARSANRDWLVGDDRKDYIGFRVVRELK
jgi:formylglycine-generating enzyme required for sulfatase activity